LKTETANKAEADQTKAGNKHHRRNRGLERAIQAKEENPGKGAGKQNAIERNKENLQRQESN